MIFIVVDSAMEMQVCFLITLINKSEIPPMGEILIFPI